MKTALQVLKEARAIIEKPENWCVGRMHERRFRPRLYPPRLFNHAYCVYGAISVASGCHLGKVLDEEAGIALYHHSDGLGAMGLNDLGNHAEVLAMFDAAIAAERAKLTPTDISVFTRMLNEPAPVMASAD